MSGLIENRVKTIPVWRRRVVTLVLVLVTFGSISAQAEFSEIIIFGDSLSDTGNVAGVVTPNLPPPYFDNRISNGPLAVDIVASSLGFDATAAAASGKNYAVVGANILGDDFEDLSQQVTRYLTDSQSFADADALYFLMLGGNDFRGLRSQLNSEIAELEIDQIVASLFQQIDRLYEAGARQILVVTAPDVGNIPQTIALEISDPQIRNRASAYVQLYNELLLNELVEYSTRQGVSVYEYDLNLAFNEMLQNPAQYGFELTEVGCFDPDNYSLHPECDTLLFPLTEPDFEKFVFFDSIHPTGKAHNIVAQAILARLRQPPLVLRPLFPIIPLINLLLED